MSAVESRCAKKIIRDCTGTREIWLEPDLQPLALPPPPAPKTEVDLVQVMRRVPVPVAVLATWAGVHTIRRAHAVHRLDENIAAADIELTPTDLRQIESAQIEARGDRYSEADQRMIDR
jgi:hypothetical protein